MGDEDWEHKHAALLASRRLRGSPTIYHYASVQAGLSILDNRTIWMSSSTTMNDAHEGRTLIDALAEHINGRSEAEISIYQILDQVAFQVQPQAYLTCFSEHADHLPQWWLYGDNGRGMVIGFDPNEGKLPVVDGLPHTNVGEGLGLTLNRVEYSPDFADLIAAMELAIAAGPASEMFLSVQHALMGKRWLIKHAGFAAEQEWRIVNVPIEFVPLQGQHREVLAEVGPRRFRESNGRIASYYEVPFERQAVVSVGLGPKCEVNEAELGMLLRDRGLKPHVWRSRIPYK